MSAAEQYAHWVLSPSNTVKTGQYIKLAAKRFLSDLTREDIYFDESEACRMINFGERYCRQWEGDWEGLPVKFEPWQKFIFEQVYGWIRKDTGTRRFDEVYVQVAKKNGKALEVDTKIPTPDGWRTMKQIVPGEFVFGDDGRPVKVLAVSEVMLKQSYEITFQGGAKIIASGDHLWEVECNDWRTQKDYVAKRKKSIVDTEFINDRYSNKITGGSILHVPTCKAVEYSERPLLIDPYLLGCWLGDGHSAGSRITIGNQDLELIEHLEHCGMSVTVGSRHRSAPNFKIGAYNELVSKLRIYDLIDNKHIPLPYLQSSVDQRFDLLKGLMDTDGTVSKKGQCTFTNINKTLIDDVYELTLSLGIKATVRSKLSKCQNGAECVSYDVAFFEDRPVFKLKRKLARQKAKLNHRSRFRSIVGIRPLGERLVKCITVDNDSRLYLAGDHFIPTHNSTMCAVLIDFHILADLKIKTPKVFTGANNEDQAKICVNMAGRIIEASPDLAELLEDETVKVFKYKDAITEIIHTEKNGLVKAFSKETSDRKSKTAGGKQGVNASLGVIDEFGMSADHGVSKPIKTSMASRRERLMFYITTAGPNMDGPCYQELRKVGIQVLEGTVMKDNYLPMIYEMDPEDDWKDESNWHKPNPNLDISVNRDFLRGMVSDAVTYGGRTEVDVKTYNFDMWVDSPEVFISGEIWDTNSHELSIDDSAVCYGGIEIGPSGEISALTLLFPGETVIIKMLWFISEEALKLNDIYRDNKELIKVDPGNEVENSIAVSWIIEEFQKYNLHSFCFPNTQKNNSIVQELIKSGYEGNPISQGMSGISNATTEWEKALRAGQVEHFNDPILKYHNSNCLAVRKEQGTRIEKNGKVLGIYACLNAWSQWKTINADGGTATVDIW